MSRRRATLSVTLPREIILWVDDQVRTRRFSTRSHAIEVALMELMREDHGELPTWRTGIAQTVR